MVAYTDKLAGRIVEEVDRLGLGEKTLILFAGDNGTDRTITSRLGDRDIPGGKTSLTEAGTRVPLIARWPGIVARGGVAEELVDFTDFFPTILEAAGVAMPPGYQVDGRTFRQARGEPTRAATGSTGTASARGAFAATGTGSTAPASSGTWGRTPTTRSRPAPVRRQPQPASGSPRRWPNCTARRSAREPSRRSGTPGAAVGDPP